MHAAQQKVIWITVLYNNSSRYHLSCSVCRRFSAFCIGFICCIANYIVNYYGRVLVRCASICL